MKPKKFTVYENALINIMKLGGVCWDGERKCHDPQYVARVALMKGNPSLNKEIDSVPYSRFEVSKKTGEVKIKKNAAKAKARGVE